MTRKRQSILRDKELYLWILFAVAITFLWISFGGIK